MTNEVTPAVETVSMNSVSSSKLSRFAAHAAQTCQLPLVAHLIYAEPALDCYRDVDSVSHRLQQL